MAQVTLELPSLLAQLVDTPRQQSAHGDTIRDVVEGLLHEHPALRVHFFDETGGLRRFVLCFINGEDSSWYDGLDTPVTSGDTITVLQSVAGG